MRRNAYCPRKKQPKEGVEEEEEAVVSVIEHENHLWVPLYQAERAWAQACEIQKQKRPSKTQQLVSRKLRKAVKFYELAFQIHEQADTRRPSLFFLLATINNLGITVN